jgi:hypothetical protein
MIGQAPTPDGDDIGSVLGDQITVTLDRWSAGQLGLVDIVIAGIIIGVATLVGWIVRRVARRIGARRVGVARGAVEGLGQLISAGIVLLAVATVRTEKSPCSG